jgi:hypothetical protein
MSDASVRTRVVAIAVMLVGCATTVRAEPVDFQREILPLLADRCFACHGPDAGSREADLRLDTEAGALAELGGGGHAIVPQDPAASRLLERIRSTDDAMRMPPLESNLRVTPAEAELLERWIAEGGKYAAHWSFVPLPPKIMPPTVENASWPASPIDQFVLARLESKGLSPSPPAAKLAWLRRVTFDLTGLPPTPSEIDDFTADVTPGAYEKVVDRLLASPHFGEHMAVPWLDAARYADSYGYQSDLLCTTWPWRDWVVRALNENLPFDQFLTWQLAGDLLPNPTRDQRLATAFNRLHRMTNEGGSIAEEFRLEYAADRAQTLGTAVLGLTVECARCHDHKFDPISQREFYQLTAIFDNIDEWGTYGDMERTPTPTMLLPTPEQEQRWRQLQEALTSSEQALHDARYEGEERFRDWLTMAKPSECISQGLVGYYPLDEIGTNHQLTNMADPTAHGSTSAANSVVPGKIGNALQLAGDEAVSFPRVCGALKPDEAFTVAMWLHVPKSAGDGLIFHRSGGTDMGYHGTELNLRDGRLFFGMIRFWPGNAIAVESKGSFPKGHWVHVVITYDGSVSAGGMHLYIDGVQVDRVVRDSLTKFPGQDGNGLTFGERFRDQTLREMKVDELRTYNRPLASVEAAQLHDATSIAKALEHQDAALLRDYYYEVIDAEVKDAKQQRNERAAELLAFQTGLLEVMVMEELPAPRDTHLLARGEYDAPKNNDTLVTPGVPAILGTLPDRAGGSRLDLARWLTSPDHPLTARVAVNRYWQLFFGRGLVETSEDFGTQGSAPSHPELLDWLARDFIDGGWDVKRFCKQVVLSSTYRQASNTTAWEVDPLNTLLARGPSGRMSAEVLRDSALAAAGLLDPRRGGPPVSPYQPGDLWTESNSMSPAYRQSVGGDLYRRSLYTVVKRTAPAPNMTAFDSSSREVCTARRTITNTPIQALVLLNDVQFVEAARMLAEGMLQDAGSTDEQRVDYAFLRLTGRHSTAEERGLLVELLGEQRRHFEQHPSMAKALVALGERKPDSQLSVTDLAAATIVVQTIQNLDATVWKR